MSELATTPGVAHPIIARVFAEMQGQQITYEALAGQAELSMQTLFMWKKGRDARLQNIEAVLNALGYRLVIDRLPTE